MSRNNILSEKDRKFREFSLNGSIWKVVLKVGTPLAVYESLNQLFKIFDTMMASYIGSDSVSAVAYLSQINMMLSALGGGLAVGAGIQISAAYGAGDYELVKKRVSSLYAMCVGMGVLVLACILPFKEEFLKLAGTPETLIEIGTAYFVIELFSMVIFFFNNVYIAVERARGSTKKILYLNGVVIILKLALTALFVYGMNGDLIMIAIATLISQGFLFLFALIQIMREGDNVFGLDLRQVTLKRNVTKPMLIQSIPVIIEKIAFAFGKVVVNAMCTIYGATMVGALGVSNNIGGITTNPQNGYQAGTASIISQNMGAGKYKRVLKAFYATLIINVVMGTIFFVLVMWQLTFISGCFAGNDYAFQEMIIGIYKYEALGSVILGANAAVLAFLYGIGETKITLVLNFARVFIFRIPVLWAFQNFTNAGERSVGLVMMISNISAGISALMVAIYYVRKIKKRL